MRTRSRISISLGVGASILLLPAAGALAVDAADVGFDDSGTATITGSDVQAALESADDAITDLHAGVDADADVVYVRADCTGMRNCFTSMSALVGDPNPNTSVPPTHPSTYTNSAWLWSVRQPSPALPVLVDVGPGTWGPFLCPDHTEGAAFGGITVRGSGRETSVLQGVAAGFDARNCFELQVMDMTILGERYGVRWADEGSANWHDVDIIAERTSGTISAAWADGCGERRNAAERSLPVQLEGDRPR